MKVRHQDGNVPAPEDRSVVYVIDDDLPVLETTALLLQLEGHETRTYGSGKQFLETSDLVRPGCILLDVRMPVLSGLEVQQELERRGAPMPIVMMTGHGDVATAVRAMKAGAVDFIEKPFSSDQLIEAVERALKLSRQQSSSPKVREARARMARLSPRECQVLQALLRGGSNKTIAGDLGLSPRTVEMHRANMMERLRVRSLPEALRLAYDAGLNAS
jgi:two-component system, LuxR family, response regulator FixJ